MPTHTIDAAAYIIPTPEGLAYRLIDVREVQIPDDIGEALKPLTSGTAILRHRLALIAGEPIEADWSYYPVELARGTELERARLICGGAPRVLDEQGFPEREFVDEVSAREATSYEARLLELPEGAQVVQQFRVVYSDGQRLVEVSVLVKPAQRCKLRYRQAVE